jgi:hypothetical protein
VDGVRRDAGACLQRGSVPVERSGHAASRPADGQPRPDPGERNLGKTLGALADIEDARGHRDAAIPLQRDALRYSYLARDVDGIAVSYHNLGNYLNLYARQPTPALACHLAAALISALAGAEGAGDSVHSSGIDLRVFGAVAPPPTDVTDLCRQLSDISGTDLADLLHALSPDPDATDRALRDLIAQAQALAAAPPDDDQR